MFVEYLCNCSPKIKTKIIKNYSSILAIANHRNWLDDSLPLGIFKHKSYGKTALKPARGSGGALCAPKRGPESLAFSTFFEDKMHRLVTLQVVTPKLHTRTTTSWIGTFLS